ncbi:hypothetical protein DFS33DRAFT_1490620 [Desarmillaria ectypa]|nr:hypothetical protein DFS33DRAFT_1490620 [Desarmillaria ectypa]
MFSSTIAFLFSALFFTAAAASPLDARSTCHPNFEGAALTVTGSGLLWTANPAVGAPVTLSSQGSKFFFQQNGTPDVTYTIKTVANNNFAVELNDVELVMDNVDWSGSNVNQKWTVECSTCATNISQQKGVVASGCIIASSNASTNGWCVTSGFPLTIIPCSRRWNQVFDFSV